MSHFWRAGSLHPLDAALLLSPAALFFFLRDRPNLDRVYQMPLEHVYFVSLTARAALTLAIIDGIAAIRSRAPRTFSVTVGLLAVAGIFSVHELMTPGGHMVEPESHNGIAISACLNLFIGGLCSLLSTVNLRIGVERFIASNHRRLFGVAAPPVRAYIAANPVRPSLLDSISTGDDPKPPAPSKTPGNQTRPDNSWKVKPPKHSIQTVSRHDSRCLIADPLNRDRVISDLESDARDDDRRAGPFQEPACPLVIPSNAEGPPAASVLPSEAYVLATLTPPFRSGEQSRPRSARHRGLCDEESTLDQPAITRR
jgi:hypothetical protein